MRLVVLVGLAQARIERLHEMGDARRRRHVTGKFHHVNMTIAAVIIIGMKSGLTP